MKVGFTPREAYSVYRSLAKEVFNNYNYEHRFPRYRTLTFPHTYNALAMTDFSNVGWTGENPFSTLHFMTDVTAPASLVAMNAIYLPLISEDELIGTILHELAHVVTGFVAGHGPVWEAFTKEIGGHADPALLIRQWMNLPSAFKPTDYFVNAMRKGIPDYANA